MVNHNILGDGLGLARPFYFCLFTFALLPCPLLNTKFPEPKSQPFTIAFGVVLRSGTQRVSRIAPMARNFLRRCWRMYGHTT
jgi:hypothetical protein